MRGSPQSPDDNDEDDEDEDEDDDDDQAFFVAHKSFFNFTETLQTFSS